MRDLPGHRVDEEVRQKRHDDAPGGEDEAREDEGVLPEEMDGMPDIAGGLVHTHLGFDLCSSLPFPSLTQYAILGSSFA